VRFSFFSGGIEGTCDGTGGGWGGSMILWCWVYLLDDGAFDWMQRMMMQRAWWCDGARARVVLEGVFFLELGALQVAKW
jgi:hypothetical protein